MTFSSLKFSDRYRRLGDDAEAVFEEVFEDRWERFGMKRPSFSMVKVPAFVRHAPDYVTSSRLFEVKAVGGDQVLKLKVEEYVSLNAWDVHMDVWLFLWDSTNLRHTVVPLSLLADVIGSPTQGVVTDRFPADGKLHFRIPINQIPVRWTHKEKKK